MTVDHQEDNSIDTNLETDSNNGEPAFRTPKVKNFRTLQDDLIHAVQEEDHSIAKVVLSARERKWEERAKNEKFRDPEVEQMKRHTALQIFCIIGIFVGTFFFLKTIVHSNLFTQTSKTETIQRVSFKPTKEMFIDVSRETKDTFEKTLKKTITRIAVPQNGSFIKILLIKQNKPLSTTDFLDLWTTSQTTDKNANIFKDNYSLGLYASEGKLFTFILLPFSGQQNIEKIMTAWESSLYGDTRTLFIKTGTIITPFFKDAAASGTKLRVLEFGKQDPAVIYRTLKNNTILITENANMLEKI
jgi:hypothetical protein